MCGCDSGAVEGAKGEASLVIQSRSTGPQLGLLGSISHSFPGAVLTGTRINVRHATAPMCSLIVAIGHEIKMLTYSQKAREIRSVYLQFIQTFYNVPHSKGMLSVHRGDTSFIG